MNELLNTIVTQRGQIGQALFEHLSLSFWALIIAALLAIPLAIILKNTKHAGEVVLQLAGIMQTIPSLALLGLLIPLVGIGSVPALIALVVYGIMPIYQNTYSGLRSVDPNLEEAATAFGLSRWKKLTRLELPMALPVILSGIRISLVMIIGTATLAALIGAGGLGTYIMLGINQNNNAYLIIGAGLSALLALLMSALLKYIGASKKHFKQGVIVALIALLGVGGWKVWNSYQSESEPIVIAGKMGGEPDILIHMYKDLIENDDPHAKVELKANFGGTSFLFRALRNDQIDIYPEFTGTVLQSLVHDQRKTPHDPAKTYQRARKLLQQQYGMTYLKPMKYQNGYDLAVRADFAKTHHLSSLSDLNKINDQLTAGFDPDFANQKDGYLGLKSAYGLNFSQVKTMEPTLRYQAIADGRVNVVDGYTTDPQIRQYNLKVLKDDKNFFPPYQGAPLLKQSFAKKHTQVVKSLNKLAGKISEKDMQEMNYQVTIKHQKASTVAHNYLLKHHLIEK